MEMPQPHTVYLSRQALVLLEKARYLSDTSEWVFPAVQTLSKPMADVAINHLFSKLWANNDIPKVFAPHGLRSMANTLMNEEYFLPNVVEVILAHKEKDATRGSYNHARYVNGVTEALQWYADSSTRW